MAGDLPYAVEATVSLKEYEISFLREEYQAELPTPSIQTKFNYAWGLVRSSSTQDQEKGVALLQDIYSESPSRRRECLYYLALGNFKLGKYREARKFNDALLNVEGQNPQALSLRSLINERVQRDGLVGVGIVGGIVVAGSVLLSALFRKK